MTPELQSLLTRAASQLFTASYQLEGDTAKACKDMAIELHDACENDWWERHRANVAKGAAETLVREHGWMPNEHYCEARR